jgi:putative oxidoreductase
MTARETVADRVTPILSALVRAQWIPALLVRLFVGYLFFETGYAKVGHLEAMAQRFTGWGIPFPAFSAALSGWTELVGGGLLALGLATRLAAIPLFINMVVAIAVVNLRGVSGLDEFVELSEPLYALCFLWLLFAGPGPVSLDRLLGRLIRGGHGETTMNVKTLLALLGTAVAIAAAVLSLARGSDAQGGGRVGQPAPEITGGPWINSEPRSLAQLRGRVVLVEFWTFG